MLPERGYSRRRGTFCARDSRSRDDGQREGEGGKSIGLSLTLSRWGSNHTALSVLYVESFARARRPASPPPREEKKKWGVEPWRVGRDRSLKTRLACIMHHKYSHYMMEEWGHSHSRCVAQYTHAQLVDGSKSGPCGPSSVRPSVRSSPPSSLSTRITCQQQ